MLPDLWEVASRSVPQPSLFPHKQSYLFELGDWCCHCTEHYVCIFSVWL